MSKFDPHRYTITIKLVTLDEGEHFEALVAELPDLVEYGATYDKAYSLALEAITELNEAAQGQGRAFPAPLPSQALVEYSGRVTLRMAKSLHASASMLADRDDVSLNSWIVEAVAARVGAFAAADSLARDYRLSNLTGTRYTSLPGKIIDWVTWDREGVSSNAPVHITVPLAMRAPGNRRLHG